MTVSLVTVLGSIPVMAQGDASKMEVALIAIKGKVDIPAEFSELDSSTYK